MKEEVSFDIKSSLLKKRSGSPQSIGGLPPLKWNSSHPHSIFQFYEKVCIICEILPPSRMAEFWSCVEREGMNVGLNLVVDRIFFCI